MNPLTKRLAIFLALSLGINLLLGGFLLGRRFHGPGPQPHGMHERGPMMQRERGRMLKNIARKPEWRALQSANRVARERAAGAFEQEPFDPAAADAALGALREETGRAQKALHDELLQRAKSGDANQRRELGRAFRRAPLPGAE
ncbi:MAG: periplasmic heavy metal sensor [Polyangiaceae bacterium]